MRLLLLACLVVAGALRGELAGSVRPRGDGLAEPAVQKMTGPVDRHGDSLPAGAIARLGSVPAARPGGNFPRAAVSEDGKFIAVCGGAGAAVQVWNAATGMEVHRLKAAGLEAGDSAAFSPDDTLLVSNGSTIVVWDLAAGKELRRWPGPFTSGAVTFADGGKTIVAVSSQGVIHRWDLKTGKQITTWNALAGLKKDRQVDCRLVHAQLSGDGTKMAAKVETESHHSGLSVREHFGLLYDTAKAKLLWKVTLRGDLQLTPSGLFAYYQEANTICICNAATGDEINRFYLPRAHENINGDIRSFFDGAALSPDGTKLVMSFNGWVGQVWDAKTSKALKEIELPWY
jgi:WD40 repeat protein